MAADEVLRPQRRGRGLSRRRGQPVKITDVEAIVVEKPSIDLTAADAMQDAFLVRVQTDEGIVGYGEGNHTPRAMKAILESPGSHSWSQGIKDLLLGQDPLQPEQLWRRIYRATAMSGRRGLLIAVLAALDVALWDIKGKAYGKPVYELLGGASGKPVVPYSTLYPGPCAWDDTLRWNAETIAQSLELGFRAIKLEPLEDCAPTNREVVELAEAARAIVGPDLDLLVDVGHRWQTAKEALRVLRRLEEHGVALIETPLWLDDVDGYRQLSDRTTVPVALGELFVTRNEFLEMMDHGHVDVVQPCVARVGFTESRRIAEDAAVRGKSVVPFGWVATTLALAADIHLAATLHNSPWCEYCHPEIYPHQELRRNLFGPEPKMVDGVFELPTGPGLGVEVDEQALLHYRVA
jgi:L-alanine-DL-glutamate epimerase-like enolase superfamily enzyme